MKNDTYLSTTPPRVAGFLIQLCVVLVTSAGTAEFMRLALSERTGLISLVYVALALVLILPIPVLIYRMGALMSARYRISRDGVQLRWGMRQEELPMDEVEWIRIDRAGRTQLSLPRIYWPGSILGVQENEEYGEIEYLASRPGDLVLIKSRGRCFAISPIDAANFVAIYQQALELGSLSPMQPRSIFPSFPLAKAWEIRPARFILLIGMLLNLFLLVWVSLVVPRHETIALGYESPGVPTQPVPSGQLYLLPFIGLFFYVLDFVLGWIYYRREEQRLSAYILWMGSVITPLMLIVAYVFILQTL